MEIQTRDNNGELRFFTSMKEAMSYANSNHGVWKVSFSLPNGERVRLVRLVSDSWMYEAINLRYWESTPVIK
jgi:hypothetical protein